jgi:hypothetical protein
MSAMRLVISVSEMVFGSVALIWLVRLFTVRGFVAFVGRNVPTIVKR